MAGRVDDNEEWDGGSEQPPPQVGCLDTWTKGEVVIAIAYLDVYREQKSGPGPFDSESRKHVYYYYP